MVKKVKNAVLKNLSVIALTLIVTGFVAMNDHVSFLLKTSVLGFPEHDPFDGTAYPIEEVPDWVHVSSDNWSMNYDDLSSSDLIDIPFYDPSELKMSTDSLQWGNSSDDEIRNAKITYSVPYMGNYKLDGRENAGSHLAVDIKVPTGTPVHAIANGTVIKVSKITSGFGYHVVIQHNDFPTLDDEDASETLYSAYCHMSQISVSEGDVVDKGDKIGESGSSGTATTPHLHFQLDNSEAPWHPYWPFTWQEASDAGLDFFSAINEGLGKSSAMKTTENPMKYVQKYMNSTSKNKSKSKDKDKNEGDDNSVKSNSYVSNDEDADENQEEDNSEVADDNADEVAVVNYFDIDVPDSLFLGNEGSFTITAFDNYGEVFKGDFDAEIELYAENGNVDLDSESLNVHDFENGIYTGTFKASDKGSEKIKVSYSLTGKSVKKSSSKFKILGTNDAMDFKDVNKRDKYYDAITALSKARVINGRPDGTFGADDSVNRVEALKFVLGGVEAPLKNGDVPFADTEEGAWYSDYLYTAYKNGVVSGYNDGSFKPANPVNKVEFLKMLFTGMDVEVPQDVRIAPYEDVVVGEWFTPIVAYAKDLGLIEDGQKFYPGEPMSRGEVAYAIHQLMESMK